MKTTKRLPDETALRCKLKMRTAIFNWVDQRMTGASLESREGLKYLVDRFLDCCFEWMKIYAADVDEYATRYLEEHSKRLGFSPEEPDDSMELLKYIKSGSILGMSNN